MTQQIATLSVVSDEIDQDLANACAVAAELGIDAVELNSLWDAPSDQLSADQVRQVCQLVDRYGLHVSAVSVAAFKAIELSKEPDLAASSTFQEHMGMIERAAHVADALGDRMLSRSVRVFSFRREPMQGLGNPWPILPDGGGVPATFLPRIVEGLSLAGDLAKRLGVRLLIENVRSCWGNSGENTAAILKALNRPEYGAIWDIANDYVSCGQPWSVGYNATLPWSEAVHWKDATVLDWASGLTAWKAIGEGAIDVAGQAQALASRPLPGPIVLETHWRGDGMTKEASSRHSFQGLKTHLVVAGLVSA